MPDAVSADSVPMSGTMLSGWSAERKRVKMVRKYGSDLRLQNRTRPCSFNVFCCDPLLHGWKRAGCRRKRKTGKRDQQSL